MKPGPAFDWGHPKPPDWAGPRDALHCRLPSELLFDLRQRAAREGVSIGHLVRILLDQAMGGEHDRVLESALRDHAH
ncbi:hypothetical protein HQ535_01660 [bacterium]|nr:hypothetical protein [bacterium]